MVCLCTPKVRIRAHHICVHYMCCCYWCNVGMKKQQQEEINKAICALRTLFSLSISFRLVYGWNQQQQNNSNSCWFVMFIIFIRLVSASCACTRAKKRLEFIRLVCCCYAYEFLFSLSHLFFFLKLLLLWFFVWLYFQHSVFYIFVFRFDSGIKREKKAKKKVQIPNEKNAPTKHTEQNVYVYLHKTCVCYWTEGNKKTLSGTTSHHSAGKSHVNKHFQ